LQNDITRLKKMPVRFIIFSIVFIWVSLSGFAQNHRDYRLKWKDQTIFRSGAVTPVNLLMFDGCYYNDADQPVFSMQIENPESGSRPEIADALFVPLTALEMKAAGLDADSNFMQTSWNIVADRKKPTGIFSFVPLRKNPLNGQTEKLVSFTLRMQPDMELKISGKSKGRTYASSSVLKSGYWFRMVVSQTGIHRISYDDFVQMGFDPSATDPRSIKLYGNGGFMLSEKNSDIHPDDLVENAIYVHGENDGAFNSGDYILFYAQGPVSWTYRSSSAQFEHQKNNYSVTSSYFITAGGTYGKRIGTQPSENAAANYSVTEFTDYDYREKDSLNLIKSGREWYGEAFSTTTSRTFVFNFAGLVPGSTLKLRSALLARSVQYSTSFSVYSNGNKIADVPIAWVPADYTAAYARIAHNNTTFSASSPVGIRIDYNKGGNASAVGWLDYLAINARCYLNFNGGQMDFRSVDASGQGVSEFLLTNGSAARIWNVSNPYTPTFVETSSNGSTLSWKLQTDSILEFVAEDGAEYYKVTLAQPVANQDLHGISHADMVVISHPDFLYHAGRLADFHRTRDGLAVVVVTPEQVYNEFSSGNQDVTAFRDFMKMLYDRAGSDPALMPDYLLLFGDASYDFLNRLPDNTNFVPTYQSVNSLEPTASFLTDDYYGFLDDSEDGPDSAILDIAIGRLPAKTPEEAASLVDKILMYAANTDHTGGSASCGGFSAAISNLGDWRNVVCFVADDADKLNENFLNESENIAKRLDTVHPNYNVDKIYLDAYEQVSTPGGQRYPDAADAILKRVKKGALIINYIGHGGEIGWAHEAILGVSDINAMDNTYNLPMFITATCEFSRFDDPERTAAGEYVLMNASGGGISLFTTTRLAFSGSNASLNTMFYQLVFAKPYGKHLTMGEVVKMSKNAFNCPNSMSNFCLLGDPALRLAYPEYNVVTSTLNAVPVGSGNDTIKALSKVTVTGYISDSYGNKINDFNGLIFPSVFDKRAQLTSRGNDAGVPTPYVLQKNIIFKGKASITAGDFSFSFVVPKDIAYAWGKGRISYYAHNGSTDAAGNFRNFIIGGTENVSITDKDGPDIRLYLNDDKFVSGGLTDQNPVLIAKISDSGGINTVGNGIGHDISAVLDHNTGKTIVLNDYYESDLNTYQSGMVRYPFSKLSAGEHNLMLKVWDIYNNSSEHSIDFVVAESAKLALNHVLNYPNPFTTYTEFWFEHNQPCCALQVQIQIFTVSGKLVKTIHTEIETTGYRAEPIPWDGLDDFGDPIGRGVYVYVLRVKNDNGEIADKTEKLVILK
jgi:hypothetical protein